ncbi:hypothetical protein [Paenibacillus sp. FSL F4-0097]|uniref:hypothetical protein n=1 Tax=Paenibacillus sp. FSL F4-0097 TaxID=2921369 RepID=UPI003157F5A7
MNFNQSVKVQLTDFGEQILRSRHEEWNLHYLERGAKDIGPYVSKVDSEGYTRFQIWEFMQKFGPHMSIAKPEPFKGEMIFLNGEPTEFPNRTDADKEFIREFDKAHVRTLNP